jgi:transposase-like protein
MHGTKIPVRTWVFVLYEICASKNGIAAREIERRYGIAGRSAWFMVHRIREAMKVNGLAGLFSGTVVADETFIGPNPRNFHKGRRFQADHAKRAHKVAVLSLVHRESGEVRSQVVANVRGLTLRAAIESQVDLPQTVLHTDSAESYVKIGWKAAGHESVNHGMSEYVRDGVSTNMAEGYFSQLKRSLDGTHHHVSREHLPRYLAEFDFRYSTCHDTDTERMLNLVGRVGGRRLAYRTVTADRQPVAAAS